MTQIFSSIEDPAGPSVVILAQAISGRTCTVFFFELFTGFPGVVLSKCLQPSFVVFHVLSWHVWGMEQTCQHPRFQPPLRIWYLLMILLLTLKGRILRHNKGGENQRHLHTVTALHAKRGQVWKLRPDACSDSGRPDDWDYKYWTNCWELCGSRYHTGNECNVLLQYPWLCKILECIRK